MLIGRCCHCSNATGNVYCDYYSGTPSVVSAFTPFETAVTTEFESGGSSGVDVLLPSVAADLDDCSLYCVGVFGHDRYGPSSQGSKWTLTSAQEDLIAAWVDTGGKVIMCMEYHRLLPLSNNITQESNNYYDAAEAFLTKCGLSVTFGREDAAGPSPPWPTDTFLSTTLTSGVSESFEYDGSAGTSFTFTPSGAGTKIYDGTQQTAAYFASGSGWVILTGSQNLLWGNKDKDQTTPTNYTAIEKLLANYFAH